MFDHQIEASITTIWKRAMVQKCLDSGTNRQVSKIDRDRHVYRAKERIYSELLRSVSQSSKIHEHHRDFSLPSRSIKRRLLHQRLKQTIRRFEVSYNSLFLHAWHDSSLVELGLLQEPNREYHTKEKRVYVLFFNEYNLSWLNCQFYFRLLRRSIGFWFRFNFVIASMSLDLNVIN